MKPTTLLRRFEDKLPLMYFFVVGIGGGSFFVFLMRQVHPFFVAPEFSNVFDHITVFLAMLWIVWCVFKYAFR